MVDSRWTVKVSFFGLHSLTDVSEVHCGDDERNYSDLLWTAPELLRMGESVPEGDTEKGDVYSFGIILQEILYRNTPFFFGDVSEKGKKVFGKVGKSTFIRCTFIKTSISHAIHRRC